MVGMSKNKSVFGRRSNWFKIRSFLHVQQELAAAQGNTQSLSSLSMPGYATYPHILHGRQLCTEEKLFRLGFEDYKRSSASPSISPPDCHNSDNLIEAGDRRNSLERQQMHSGRATFNKEPFGFPGLAMGPYGFLPPSHLMFPEYNPELYALRHGLLKPVMDTTSMLSGSDGSSPLVVNNNNHTTNYNSKAEEKANQYILDATPNRYQKNVPAKCDEINTEVHLVVSSTSPRSPAALSPVALLSAIPQRLSLPFPRPVTSVMSISEMIAEDIPIDLSININRRCTLDRKTQNSSFCDGHDDCEDFKAKRIKIDRVTSVIAASSPLDLSTKVEWS